MTPKQLATLVVAFLATCGLGGGVLAAMAVPLAATTGTAANAVTRVFDDLPTEISFTEPSQQSVLLASDGTVLARFYSENRIVVPSSDISPLLKEAVVAIEDERFYEHNGIDAQGLLGAAINNMTGGNLAGGSTITQQYVKNAMIEEGRITGDDELISQATERSIGRKLNEARFAIAVENKMTKDEILTGYLNLAQFGPSQYGVEAASKYFFSKSAKDVTLEEAAMLAGITQSPARWNPVRHPEAAKSRRDTVLAQMYNLGYITREELDAAVAVKIEDMLKVSPSTNGCAEAGISAYACEYVTKELLNSELLGKTREERVHKLYRGGLTIQTTFSPERQQQAYDALVASVPEDDASSIEMAMSSIEPGTGKIQAMVQNTSYGTATEEDPDRTKVNLNVNVEMGGGQGFQSGSTFKIFTLLEWLRTGHSAYETIDTSGREYPRDRWTISCAPNVADDYRAYNLEGVGGGNMTVMDATRKSVNVAFVNMASQMDMCNIVDGAAKLGVERGGYPSSLEATALGSKLDEIAPLYPNPSAVLGSNTVTPLSFANAMATLAADGEYCEPMSFTTVKDNAGTIIAEKTPACRQVFDADLMRQTTSVLEHVVAKGSTGENAILSGGRDAAGKTGTANNDWHAWFVGYTPQLATAVWQGHMDGNISMFNTRINGRFYGEVYGGLFPAKSFKAYMDAALAGQPNIPFQDPKKSVLTRPKAAVPDVSGMTRAQATKAIRDAGFRATPVEVFADAPKGAVVGTNPDAGVMYEQGRSVSLGISKGPEPAPTPSATPTPSPAATTLPADPERPRGNNGNGNG